MKPILLFVSLFIFHAITAQTYPQIRLKTGVSVLLPSPGGRGYAYRTVPGLGSSVVIGGEYSHPLKNKKGAWQVGFTFQDGVSSPTPNRRNLNPINIATTSTTQGLIGRSYMGVGPSKTVIYGGFEEFINRNYEKPSKNYFSVIGGAGLSFTLNNLKDWEYSRDEKYTAHDGSTVEGFTSNFKRPSFPLAPSVYGGLRYNITNRKGNEVFIIELLVNYGITSYYKQTIDYRLNGVPQRDVLKEKGFNIQLNLIVPLHTFYRRHKK